MTPIVAMVGRPNVGKSTLFNRLAGKTLAIVHDQPGVTRDRNYTDTTIAGREVTLVDTGGFDTDTDDPMGQGIARHVEAAIAEADLIVCVLDGSGPPTLPDREAIQLLRRSSKPVLYVGNKIDNPDQELSLTQHYELGIPELLGVSALHGRHVGKLERAITLSLGEPPASPEPQEAPDAVRLAFIGRPNAGKSSLFNRLSGTERSLVDSRPGTTRDPVDHLIDFKGNRFLLIDTAGVRRKTRVEKGIEAQSVIRSIRAISSAQVIVLMVDVTQGLSDQDAKLMALSTQRGRAVVVGLNKADLLSARELKKAEEETRHSLHFAPWTPLIAMSANTGYGVGKLMLRVKRCAEMMGHRVPTAQLNRFFDQVLESHPPPIRAGKAPRLYYITQAGTHPPTFVAFCSSPQHVAESYRRFVVNRIRAEFNYEGVPVRLFFRSKRA